jgi:sugar lactone lactonase YvrE
LALAFSPDGRILAVADHTAGLLVRLDPQSGKVIGKTELSGRRGLVA